MGLIASGSIPTPNAAWIDNEPEQYRQARQQVRVVRPDMTEQTKRARAGRHIIIGHDRWAGAVHACMHARTHVRAYVSA